MFFLKNKSGSALVLTMFIMSGMLLVALSGAYVILLGIKSGGIQAQSTKAYYAAEAGAEALLWEMRHNNCVDTCTATISEDTAILSGNLSESNLSYAIYFVDWVPWTFRSIGEYKNVRRSVEVRM
jgi:hypothetical protein